MSLDFNTLLQRYADLTVRVGLNLQPGQRLLIRAPVEAVQLVRLITDRAYQDGARLVQIIWRDEQLNVSRLRYAPRDSFTEFPAWQAKAIEEYAAQGEAMLAIISPDPDLYTGLDTEAVATMQRVERQYYKGYMEHVVRSTMNWLGIAMPNPAWAAKIFPQLPSEQQMPQLWATLFRLCRLDTPDPIAAWETHISQLSLRSAYLNTKQYAALRYHAPGTDLTIGLPHGHIWKSARDTSQRGIPFTPNLPTEEIFTLPHRARVDGVVTATKPLNLNGALVDGFQMTFAEGRVTTLRASVGEEHLQRLVDTDEGARFLGEVALVPHNSPIAQSGLLFFNTLFDENAASHIALGRAYQFTLQGGEQMSDGEFAQAGGNISIVHTDFMIGSEHMDIDGVTEGGQAEPVMRAGEWAFSI